MKIRIRANSVRFRLTKSEVEAFCKNGYIENVTEFGKKKFTYAIRADNKVDQLNADFDGNTITMYVNQNKSSDWATNEKIGFECTVETNAKCKLSLLLEKDFVCMDETVEDQSDNYPNPKA